MSPVMVVFIRFLYLSFDVSQGYDFVHFYTLCVFCVFSAIVQLTAGEVTPIDMLSNSSTQ